MGNLVAIVGRPNVGKSTLFNRLTKTRHAIVSDEAGTTRDRQYGKCEWGNKEFSVVDTGGWVVNSEDVFEEEIRKQVLIAIEECDVILFLVDVKTGVTDLDMEEAFSKEMNEVIEEDIPRIAVVGRPNVGKSSIINAFLNDDRNVVTDIAGTTRDSIYTKYEKFGFNFYLVDTAGIRKKNKVSEDLEYYSVMRSIRAIENSDVCVLMVDATRGIEGQDVNIFQIVQKNQKGMVVVVNKWDLVENKDTESIKHFENAIRSRMAPFTDFTIIFASALTKQRIFRVLEEAQKVYENRTNKVSTAKLNEVMLPIIENTPPPSIKGKYIKIKYCMQIPDTRVPSFVFYANLPQYVKETYRRFLENQIREHWNFTGTPINVFIRQK